ncbi:MAG: hypothetical protein AAFN11_06290 [Chloroflexota bacterium]
MPSRFSLLVTLISLTLVVWLVVLALLLDVLPIQRVEAQILLTQMIFPSATPTQTATTVHTATNTPLPTQTTLPSNTPLPTETLLPTLTPTLAVRLLEVTAVMPGVYTEPTSTPFPVGTNLLPAPPNPIEPLPDATHAAAPFMGWYSFESDYPTVQYSPVRWTARQNISASEGQYHRYEGMGSVSFPFEGEGLRVRYVAARNMGIFEVVVDGQIIDTVDAYHPDLIFTGTQVYFVGSGSHTLTIRATGRRNVQSEAITVGLDAIQVFRADANTLIIPPPAVTNTPVATPRPAQSIELVSAPATTMPTATPPAPAEISVSVVIAYDENGNRDVDPAEGVSGIPIRAVAVDSNQVIAQSVTDVHGYAQLLVIAESDLRIVAPYFGEVWDVPLSTRASNQFTLLLEPGNQPGIIP